MNDTHTYTSKYSIELTKDMMYSYIKTQAMINSKIIKNNKSTFKQQ